jgi:hypothetical protein
LRTKAALFLAGFVVGLMVASRADEIAHRRSDLPAEQRVKDLLSRMTLEEKVEQLSQKSASGITINGEEVDPASLVKRRVGIGGSIGWRVSGELLGDQPAVPPLPGPSGPDACRLRPSGYAPDP